MELYIVVMVFLFYFVFFMNIYFAFSFGVFFCYSFSFSSSYSLFSSSPILRNYNLKKTKRWNHWNRRYAFATSNVIFKQMVEYKTPFKKYNIGDIYYGQILKIDKKKIKIDILCDRKAYLKTSDFFREASFEKYIFYILKLYNVIKVKITDIDWIHKKIYVSIQKYKNEEIYFSFKKKKTILNSTVLDKFNNYALIYIAPHVHARLVLPRNHNLNKYKIGSNMLVQVDSLDRKEDELYVKPYLE